MLRKFGERVAMNTPLQGSAADIIKKAMLEADRELEGARLILQVHDELIVEAPQNELLEVKALLKEEMEAACNISLLADIKSGKTWFDAH
jgi:DNA polymerase-1